MFDNDDNSNLSSYQMELFLLRKDLQEYVDESIVTKGKIKQKRIRSKPNSAWKFSDMRTENGCVSSTGWNRIESLTKLILRRHFSNISIYKDLLQIGMVKAAGVIAEDPEKGNYRSLRTYLYTCIRNEISNYLYHTHKRTKETSEGLMFCKTRFKNVSIDNKYIDVVFNKLSKRFNVYKDFISEVIEVLSDSESFVNDYHFTEELKLRNLEMNLNYPEESLKEYFFELLYPIEKQLLVLIAYEIKKDIV